MSTKMGKTKHSKDLMRRRLASLPVDDKIRILEKLRTEEMPKPEPVEHQKSVLMRFIQRTIQGQSRVQGATISNDDLKNLALEAEAMIRGQNPSLEALNSLFPEGVPLDEQFYLRLLELQHRLGFNEAINRAIGALWLLEIRSIQVESAEGLLTAFTKLKGSHFFMLLDSLGVVLESYAISPEFARKWFSSILKRIGNDLASKGFWSALETYCVKQTDNALTVLTLSLATEDEEEATFAAFMLGTLRTLFRKGREVSGFTHLEGLFADSRVGKARKIYLRSWVQTAWGGEITRTDLESLAVSFDSATPDEHQQTIWVFSRIILGASLSTDSFIFGVSWLLQKASQSLSELAKYWIIDSATNLAEDDRFDAAELILSVQPVSAESKGSWNRLEGYLVSLLQKDVSRFVSFSLMLAERSAREWLAIMQQPRSLEWLISEMQGKELGEMVGSLVLSDHVACRKLGFFLFDALSLNSLPASLLAPVSKKKLQVALHESKRVLIHGEAIAKFLITLIPHLEGAAQPLRDDFFEELVLQAKNYGGACRIEFERRKGEFPILQRALEAAESYFTALGSVQESPISQMEMPGLHSAIRLYRRRFSNEISNGAKEASVFATLFKNVQLLYGKRWRIYQGNKLGEPSDLKNFTAEAEVPRLEQIDPEGMALRRLQAASSIDTVRRELAGKA